MNKFINRTKKPGWVISLVGLLALILSACAPASAATQSTSIGIPVTGTSVQATVQPKFGKILVNATDMTLYTFAIDSSTESKCTDSECVEYWPPLTVNGQAVAGSGVPGKLSTISRPDGRQQLTYDGKPLYTFKLDQNLGDVKGDGLNQFGGVWHVVSLGGTPGSGANPPSNGTGY